MKKLLSITVLTLFFAASINAVNLETVAFEQKESCEDLAWDTAQLLYELFGNDGFIAGQYLEQALEKCNE